jgi:hypothetical protein
MMEHIVVSDENSNPNRSEPVSKGAKETKQFSRTGSYVSGIINEWEHLHRQRDPTRDETNLMWKQSKTIDASSSETRSIGDLVVVPSVLYMNEITHFKIPQTEEFEALNAYLASSVFAKRATKFDYLRIGIYNSKPVTPPPLRLIALVTRDPKEAKTFWLAMQVKPEYGYEKQNPELFCGRTKIALFSHSKTGKEDLKYVDREWNIQIYEEKEAPVEVPIIAIPEEEIVFFQPVEEEETAAAIADKTDLEEVLSLEEEKGVGIAEEEYDGGEGKDAEGENFVENLMSVVGPEISEADVMEESLPPHILQPEETKEDSEGASFVLLQEEQKKQAPKKSPLKA